MRFFVAVKHAKKSRYCMIHVKQEEHRTFTPNHARAQHFGIFRVAWGLSPLSVRRMDDELVSQIFFSLFAPYRGWIRGAKDNSREVRSQQSDGVASQPSCCLGCGRSEAEPGA